MRGRPRRRRRTRRAATALAALLACVALWAGASLVTGAGSGEEDTQVNATEGDGAPDEAVDEALYPASAIKAVYCAMVCEEFGGAGELAGALENCLVNSSNEAYTALREAFGLEAFGAWLEEVGAEEASVQALEYGYPDISANELAAVWEEIYRFGTSGEDGADELVDALAATNYTALGALLHDECEVWAKPGWYPTDEYDLTSTNDAGVVFSECGAYVVVVMTDLPADLDGLTPLIDALDAAHDAMCGNIA